MICLALYSCQSKENQPIKSTDSVQITGTTLQVLGITQDAGYPQINCTKDCCKLLWDDLNAKKMVACVGIRHSDSKKAWLFDATPDIKFQLDALLDNHFDLDGIFLTHAHMGHYTGLMELGREAMDAKEVQVYAMPRMKSFLENNGPWSQLVHLKNIDITEMKNKNTIFISDDISITPIKVPHRDEFSETVGFLISGPSKKALFIPDIDKWDLWDEDILSFISETDYVFVDGTFYQNGEIPGRDMSEIPHPFIEESMQLFSTLPSQEKAKIHFIHLNHTNPALNKKSEAYHSILKAGFHVAEQFQEFKL